MCGIVGIAQSDPSEPAQAGTTAAMCQAIKHRGPDDDGFFSGPGVSLGMRRLSIIDVAGGQQPIENEDGSAVIVFNGEIYNYLDLRAELERCGHAFQTHSDTEAILHAYEQWGRDCPTHLRGMFCFAIWDKARRRLFIARDRLGKKPLYYHQDGARLAFASEIKALLCAPGVPRRLDRAALDAYISLGYTLAPSTLFEGIRKLPAGHWLAFEAGQIEIQPYWSLRFNPDPAADFDESVERVRTLLYDAVRVRLMSEVPLGAFLSGGIDSALVVGLMSQMSDQPVRTFSVGFEEEEHNELPYARMTAQAFGCDHHEIMLSACSPDLVEKIVWSQDEPVADPAAVPTYLVSELARRHVTVVLTGEGGDEVFAGYSQYHSHLNARRFKVLPGALSRTLLPLAGRAVNATLGRPLFHDRTLWYWSLPEGVAPAAWVAIFTDAEKRRLSGSANPFSPAPQALASLAGAYAACGARDELHRLMHIDTTTWLPDDLLMKVDKMSMAHSLEARTPYLDHPLVEYCATLPANFKLRAGVSKAILKQVAREVLPAEIVNRPKHTFDVPIDRWLRTSLKEMTRDLFADGVLPSADNHAPLFDREYLLGGLWQALEQHVPGAGRQVWSLLNLALWSRQYHVEA